MPLVLKVGARSYGQYALGTVVSLRISYAEGVRLRWKAQINSEMRTNSERSHNPRFTFYVFEHTG